MTFHFPIETTAPLRRFPIPTLMVIASLAGVFSAAPQSRADNERSVEDYRQSAMQHDGDASRGRGLFANEQRLACTKCHSTDGKGGKAGPDLFAAVDQFPRRDLVDAILLPSAKIAVGYSATVVETKSDEVLEGVLKQSTDTWIELACGDGQLTRIARDSIQEQRGSTVSLMPEGLQAGLTLHEFADLIEYLVSLKEPVNSRVVQGMPESIPELCNPAALRPFLTERLRIRGMREKMQTGLLWFAQLPGFANVFLAADQAGLIWRVEKTASSDNVSIFADFKPEVFSARGPNGLLGFAFHPRFRENRKYYVKHQVFENGKIATVLAEKFVSPDFATDSGEPSRRLLKIQAGAEHHNGGCIQFGPDGFLYLGMGDSAPNHDPQGHGQDLHLLFGKMLRLDVDHPGSGLPYAIPRDNPFHTQIQTTQARPEIWAWGFREPWRFSFDPVTGYLWVADLGQERGDEVAIVRRGENHGWNVYEGFEPFSQQHRREGGAYVSPIFASRRKHGCTIVGGEVYRGDPNSSFYGVYIFGDYTSKRIWGLTQEGGLLKTIRQIATAPESITAFSTDEQGNLYVVGYGGMVYQLDLLNSQFNDLHAVQDVAPNSK